MDPRDEAPQYVLPLVVRVERADPPTRTDALEAAALAVLTLLTDPRTTAAPPTGPAAAGRASAAAPAANADPGSGAGTVPGVRPVMEATAATGRNRAEPDATGRDGPGPDGMAPDGMVLDGAGRAGEWAAAVRAWSDARIRKVVRRARGAEWRRAGALDGLTVTRGTAEVRVFPPVQLDGWPRDLAKLQVSGTELADPRPPDPPAAGLPVLWLSPELELSAGKAMAQAGHAAQLGLAALTPEQRARWQRLGFPLAVRTAGPERWARLLAAGLPVVRDAGFTEVAPGSCTVVAEVVRGPGILAG